MNAAPLVWVVVATRLESLACTQEEWDERCARRRKELKEGGEADARP